VWLLIREAWMARNLRALLPLVEEFGTSRIAFCTDDRDPEDIAENGHINGMVCEAVEAGIAPEDAVVLATHNPATWHRLWHLGAIAPGYQADLLVLPDLDRFEPETVLKAGRPAAEIPRPDVPEWVKHSVRIQPIGERDFRIPWLAGKARVIGLVPDQVVTEHLHEEPAVADGAAVADPSRDLAKIAVIERHLGTGRVGLGFVRGSGLQSGALASTVAHDAHNIVVVGVDDGDMARAVQRLAELGGGIAVVEGGEIRAELPLPVAGLLADAPLAEVIEKSLACNDAARALYPVWAGIDAESEYAAARTGLAELALHGCTTVFDHHYVFPRGRDGLIEAEMTAARELGVRLIPSRGSMDLGQSDGGLPPDELVEEPDEILAETERLAARYPELVVAPCSPFSVTGRLMEESATLARRLGLVLHTHLAETVEEEAYCRELYGCRPAEYLERLGWLAADVGG